MTLDELREAAPAAAGRKAATMPEVAKFLSGRIAAVVATADVMDARDWARLEELSYLLMRVTQRAAGDTRAFDEIIDR